MKVEPDFALVAQKRILYILQSVHDLLVVTSDFAENCDSSDLRVHLKTRMSALCKTVIWGREVE